MSPSTPPIVTLASRLSGQQKRFPPGGAHISQGELQSLNSRLGQLIVLTARLAETFEALRLRAEAEQMNEQVNASNLPHS